MSGPPEDNGHGEDSGTLLSNLPRTRPQRASARRAAGRAGAAPAGGESAGAPPAKRAGKAAAKPAETAVSGAPAAKPASRSGAAPKRARTSGASKAPAGRARAKRAAQDEVPRQGFETEYERATGSVEPPGAADFVSTAVEAFGELAKAGISGGERLLRETFSRLGR